MFEKFKSIWNRVFDKIKTPVAALTAVGVSTTLACCYGPAPAYPIENYETIESCEMMLRDCAVAQGLWSDSCQTNTLNSCNVMLEQQAHRLRIEYDSRSKESYLDYIIRLIDQKTIPEAEGLLTLINPWAVHYTSELEYPPNAIGNKELVEVSDILANNKYFKDKQHLWLVSQIILTSPNYSRADTTAEDNLMIRPRAYELAAAAIENDSVIDPAVSFVLSEIAKDIDIENNYKYDYEKGKKYYALHLGLGKFGNALVNCYDRIHSAGNAVQEEAAKTALGELKKLAESVVAMGNTSILPTASALLDRINQLEL